MKQALALDLMARDVERLIRSSTKRHLSSIHVARYSKNLLPKTELERKLHDAVRLARARLEVGKD